MKGRQIGAFSNVIAMQKIGIRLSQTSMRETTPFVTEIVSPPSGYPTTVTASCPITREL